MQGNSPHNHDTVCQEATEKLVVNFAIHGGRPTGVGQYGQASKNLTVKRSKERCAEGLGKGNEGCHLSFEEVSVSEPLKRRRNKKLLSQLQCKHTLNYVICVMELRFIYTIRWH